MPRVDPILLPLLTDLERGLRELGIGWGVVGALVPEILLDAKPAQRTNDTDVTVVVQSLAAFDALKDDLGTYGFTRDGAPYRMRHRTGGFVDILPFSDAIAPEGRLELADGFVLNMAGFRHVVPHSVPVPIEGGPALPLTPLPLYALLKLVAFSDRGAAKDLVSLHHCLKHYAEDDERRYEAEYEGTPVPFEHTGAFLLGVDADPFMDKAVEHAVGTVLHRFTDEDSEVVAVVVRGMGRIAMDDAQRQDIFDLFRWYRLGAGL